VAEITGRTRRLVTLPDGSQRLESRTANQSLADANAFMGGAKRILVFSDAGGTGRSYHASLDAKNQQRRMHFLLEPGWRADRAIQGPWPHQPHPSGLGAGVPPVTTDCRGERRFISTIARRLDALGALTRPAADGRAEPVRSCRQPRERLRPRGADPLVSSAASRQAHQHRLCRFLRAHRPPA
jgi:hypothetical protein